VVAAEKRFAFPIIILVRRKVITMMDKVARARKWYEEGQLLLRKGDHDRSVRAFTHAMKAGWDPEISHLSRGAANMLAGHYEKALDDFTAVIDRNAMHSRALHYRGTARMMLGGYRWAIDDFSRVLEADPDHGMAVFARGVCRAHVGDYDRAAADIKQALMVAETDAQHFADTTGMWRTHLDGVLGVLHQHTDLSEEDVARLREFFEA
jgi:tetratricopeptide (TPR) repeat protein